MIELGSWHVELNDLIPDKAGLLARHEFFREVAPDVIRRLGAHARLVSFRRGERIFAKGDPGLGLLAVVSGLVRISVPSKDGKEIVLRLVTANEIFGEIALLDGGPRTADATAASKCHVLSLDRRDFVSVLEEEPALAIRLLGLVSRRLRQTSEQVEDISFADPQKRLAKALLRLAEVQGTAAAAAPSISITQKELGRTIGLSRESTNKLLRDWENAGHVSLQKGGCTIRNRTFVDELAAEAS
jgi:CRP/FNR family cyclic AMP-dependent transcriptional regulator